MPPQGPQEAPKTPQRGPQAAPKRPPRGPGATVMRKAGAKAIGQQAADILKVLVGKLIKETDRKAGTWPSVDASGTTGCRMTGKSWHVRELKSGHSLPPILQASRRRPQFGPRRGVRSVYNFLDSLLKRRLGGPVEAPIY